MALTKRQYPSNKIISCSDNYYTSTSDLYAADGFKFKYDLKYLYGTLSTSYTFPNSNLGLGIFNTKLYLKNMFTNIDFDMDQTSWDTCPNSIYNVRVDVSEFGSGTDVENFNKVNVIKTFEDDFDYIDFMLNGNTKRFLSNYRSVRKMSINDRDIVRFFSGKIGTTYSSAYEMYLEIKRNGATYVYKSLYTNPYFNDTLSGQTASNLILENSEKYLMTFGTGPQNIQNILWKYILYIPPVGFIQPQTGTPTVVSLQVGDTYDIYINYSQRKSEKISYEIICESGYQLFWENRYGGFDSHKFSLNYQKSLNINKNTYRKNNYEISGYNVVKNDYSGGLTVYHNDINTEYILNTNWLTPQEILDLEDLWYSKNVFMRIDNNIYPVVSLVENQDIDRNLKARTGLRLYTIAVRLANKKYN